MVEDTKCQVKQCSEIVGQRAAASEDSLVAIWKELSKVVWLNNQYSNNDFGLEEQEGKDHTVIYIIH